uniref:Alpha N-terminal protein methyltransferase 1 n=1 Tax=Chenopodium quinoa TaxID=63459 RepID=A0A803N8L9_CHEQI
MEIAGSDNQGREFKSAAEMWKEQLGDGDDSHKKVNWYRNGVGYWQEVDASVDGVLGGYGHVTEPDIKGSEVFLNSLLSDPLLNNGNSHRVALDCGSGIGRVTKNLLIRYFNEVDLLEPVPHFLEAAQQSLVFDGKIGADEHRATNFYCVPLQEQVSGVGHGHMLYGLTGVLKEWEFTPNSGRYDVIWVQWCIGHLTDDDFVSFFKRAKAGLKPGGYFIVKENTARNGGSDPDFVLVSASCLVDTESNKRNVKALFRRGVALEKLGALEKAFDDFKSAKEIEPNNKEIGKELARLREVVFRKQDGNEEKSEDNMHLQYGEDQISSVNEREMDSGTRLEGSKVEKEVETFVAKLEATIEVVNGVRSLTRRIVEFP